MAIIYSYPEKTTPAGGDFLVITDSQQPYPNKNRTKSLTIDNLASYVITSQNAITGGGTLNTIAMFTPDGQKIGDSRITQDATGAGVTVNTNFIVTDDTSIQGNLLTDSLEVSNDSAFNGEAIFGGDIEVTGNATFESEITINGPLYDQSGSAGAAGQVLSSTSQGVAWVAGNTNTTYDLTGAVSGANDYKIVLTGSDGTIDNVNFEAGNGIILSDQGGNTVSINAVGSGSGTTNTLPIWTDGPNGVLGDSIITQSTDLATVAGAINISGTSANPSIFNNSGLASAKVVDFLGSADFAPNAILSFGGPSAGLSIYQDDVITGDSIISDTGPGNLRITGKAKIEFRNQLSGEFYAIFNENAAVALYHDNIKKFETTTNGIEVTGTQSSFSGQVTIPTTPVASTDAASKAYVDSQVGYSTYVARVSQTGTNAPAATVISNNTGLTFTWTRQSTGSYRVTPSASFVINKTWIQMTGGDVRTPTTTIVTIKDISTGFASAVNTNLINGAAADEITAAFVEIRIYP